MRAVAMLALVLAGCASPLFGPDPYDYRPATLDLTRAGTVPVARTVEAANVTVHVVGWRYAPSVKDPETYGFVLVEVAVRNDHADATAWFSREDFTLVLDGGDERRNDPVVNDFLHYAFPRTARALPGQVLRGEVLFWGAPATGPARLDYGGFTDAWGRASVDLASRGEDAPPAASRPRPTLAFGASARVGNVTVAVHGFAEGGAYPFFEGFEQVKVSYTLERHGEGAPYLPNALAFALVDARGYYYPTAEHDRTRWDDVPVGGTVTEDGLFERPPGADVVVEFRDSDFEPVYWRGP